MTALRVTGLTKSYGAAQALRGLDLEVASGEVHALLGQNGCGKSTLVKSLTGVVTPDSGEASVDGVALTFPVAAPHSHGIAVIHQDVGLADELTGLENLGANAGYGTRLLGVVNARREASVYRDLMDSIGLDVPLDVPVALLSPADRAMLGVLRAMRVIERTGSRGLFILDEPTASLGRTEAARVLALMRRVAERGAGVVFISHRLNEVLDVCDRVTVMRDGQAVHTGPVGDIDRAEIVRHMLGRKMEDFFPAPPATFSDSVRLRASGVAGEVVAKTDLAVRAGEIVGLTGLAGMGQEELVDLLAGAKQRASGSIRIDDVEAAVESPRDAVAAGIGFVPGNRLRDGGWLDATARENLTLPVLRSFRRRGALRVRAEREYAHEQLAMSGLRPLDPERPMRGFSGGNQQKVVFAKWLQLEPKVLLLDEPTQGVDAGAAKDLLDRVVAVAAAGTAVLMNSGDHEQLVEVCHRVLVFSHGSIVAELSGPALTEEALLVNSVDPRG